MTSTSATLRISPKVHLEHNCGSPSSLPATLILIPCCLTRGCVQNLFRYLLFGTLVPTPAPCGSSVHLVPQVPFFCHYSDVARAAVRLDDVFLHLQALKRKPRKRALNPTSCFDTSSRPHHHHPKSNCGTVVLAGHSNKVPEVTWNKQLSVPSRESLKEHKEHHMDYS